MRFRIAFFSLFIAMMAVRAYFSRQVRRMHGGGWSVSQEAIAREGRWSLVVRGLLFVYMVAVVILYAFDPAWLERFAIPLPAWARWLGVGLSVVSLPLLVWVHHTLGKQWFTDLQMGEEHAMITEGPYRWIRHPMYTALFGFFIGLTLVSASWLIVLLTGASIAVLYARIGKEEAMMVEQFGDAYRAYAQRTGRLLPRLTSKSDEDVSNPKTKSNSPRHSERPAPLRHPEGTPPCHSERSEESRLRSEGDSSLRSK